MSNIRKVMQCAGKRLEFTDDEITRMQELNITRATITARVKNGWPRYYIINQPKEMSREEYDKLLEIKKLAEKNRKKREIKKQQLLLKEMKAKEHLQKYPQKVKASKYYYNLLNYALKAFR
ncbi:hypothetical protein BUZ37_09510 [Staphylococcus haemolyticus]|uniref:SA1788 family PVL leukocidin-associated protein n=1 Tax=Staphylococcus haemolyticus TaxID=1283 RepID=UPI000D1DBD90|nr:SA1788 family PVL leukocidin-associated protein [Staphylococcus haemolyticus]MCE4992082.1 hypothetical protein [Staphylococcus haemolyticus]PTK53110.1 hypothetical protein BUZ37_09510 [Staphylococcus haemolyticus]